MPSAIIANNRASVPLAQPMQCFDPVRAARRVSSSATSGPSMYWPWSRTVWMRASMSDFSLRYCALRSMNCIPSFSRILQSVGVPPVRLYGDPLFSASYSRAPVRRSFSFNELAYEHMRRLFIFNDLTGLWSAQYAAKLDSHPSQASISILIEKGIIPRHYLLQRIKLFSQLSQFRNGVAFSDPCDAFKMAALFDRG